jgi:hypothetical protein
MRVQIDREDLVFDLDVVGVCRAAVSFASLLLAPRPFAAGSRGGFGGVGGGFLGFFAEQALLKIFDFGVG